MAAVKFQRQIERTDTICGKLFLNPYVRKLHESCVALVLEHNLYTQSDLRKNKNQLHRLTSVPLSMVARRWAIGRQSKLSVATRIDPPIT